MSIRGTTWLFILLLAFSRPSTAFETLHTGHHSFLRGDTIIRVKGRVLDEKTGTPVAASIFYEKLPYYDDMGTAKSNSSEGAFEIFLLKNVSYTIHIKAGGYDAVQEELTVASGPGTDEMTKEYLLAPDKANEMIKLDNLIFERGRSKISAVSFEELDRLVTWLNERPSTYIQLEGHTDFEGNASANLQLSQERVDAVKEYLVSKGIKKARVETKAFGGTQPLTLERSDEGKRKNRRVEVRVIKE